MTKSAVVSWSGEYVNKSADRQSGTDSESARGAVCPRRSFWWLLMLIIGVALLVLGGRLHNDATRITGAALAIVGFIGGGGT